MHVFIESVMATVVGLNALLLVATIVVMSRTADHQKAG